jgi:localization factor PodJL
MGQSEISQDTSRDRPPERARAVVLHDESKFDGNKFSGAPLSAEAEVERAAFRAAGKAALAALMHPAAAPAEPAAAPAAPAPVSKAEITPEPSVSTPDAWLERRLRVFERALNALEAKAETTAREQARAIAQLEERLAALDHGGPGLNMTPVEAAAPHVQAEAPEAQAAEAPQAEKKPAPPALAPLPVLTVSKEAMADVLQSARDKARAAAIAAGPEKPAPVKSVRARWLAIGALSLMVLFLGIGLTLNNSANATQPAWAGSGVSHRHVAGGALARTIALADAGDARAQAQLALAYLRGQGVPSDPVTALRWSIVAAQAGQPVAQYLLGALYQQGGPVPADPQRAFIWFAAAAAKGNLKAMHNLGIAYAQGLGTMKDDAKAVAWFTRAAERGYVDSAFDLAVLYERGEGVPQDLEQALKWYGIAGLAGDAPSKTRAEILRGQLSPAQAKLAANAALVFAPLPALGEANSL